MSQVRDSDENHWIVALGQVKAQEQERRVQFEEWAEAQSNAIHEQRHRASNSQQLVSTLHAQICDHLKADKEFVKRLLKAAETASSTDHYSDEERSHSCFLIDFQRYHTQVLEIKAQAMQKILLENSLFKDWAPQFSKATQQTAASAEKSLKSAQQLHQEAVVLWEKHEKQCRNRMNGTAGEDLYASDRAYRRAVINFEREVQNVETFFGQLVSENENASGNGKTLVTQTLKEISEQIAKCHKSLQEALQPPPGGSLPSIPGSVQKSPRPEADARLPVKWAPMSFPPSSLVVHEGSVDRPPTTLAMFRKEKPCRLLLTISGHLYCFREDVDAVAGEPLWSAEVLASDLSTDQSTCMLVVQPFTGKWNEKIAGRAKYGVRMRSLQDLKGWETALQPWWKWKSATLVAIDDFLDDSQEASNDQIENPSPRPPTPSPPPVLSANQSEAGSEKDESTEPSESNASPVVLPTDVDVISRGLPPGWYSTVDSNTHKRYYWNHSTGQCQWHSPEHFIMDQTAGSAAASEASSSSSSQSKATPAFGKVSSQGAVSITMRSADKWCVRRMHVQAESDEFSQGGLGPRRLIKWSGSGLEVHHTLPEGIERLQITFSTVGGNDICAVDRSKPGTPWVKTQTGYLKERFVYLRPGRGFKAIFTLKGTLHHCYVSDVAVDAPCGVQVGVDASDVQAYGED